MRHSLLMKKKIHEWKPWEQSSGPATNEGKSISCRNSLKHGWFSVKSKQKAKILRSYIQQCNNEDSPSNLEKMILKTLNEPW